MKHIAYLLLSASLLSCSAEQSTDAEKDQKLSSENAELYKQYNLREADDLVLEAFSNADVVILGENHFIGEHVDFVSNLIPKLHEQGIYTLYSEFLHLEQTEYADSLVNAEVFDEQAVKNMLVQNLWDWNYREYLEMYRVVWEFNKTITSGRKFKIIGIDLAYDYSAIQKQEDWDNPVNRRAFFREGEKAWADRIIANSVDKGEKALVYCGYNHALTYYRQPYLLENGEFGGLVKKERAGQYLYEYLGDRCAFLLFHVPWESKKGYEEPNLAPLSGRLDAIADSLTGEQKVYGFYTRTSSLGSIIDTNGFFSLGYPDFKLTDLCDGYLVIEPLCELSICEFIPNFIDSTNIHIARPQVKAWEDIENISVTEANSILRKYYSEKVESFELNKGRFNCSGGN